MSYLQGLWHWIAAHWAWIVTPTGIAAITGAIMLFPKWRKAWAEAQLAQRQNQQSKLALETRALGQLITNYANAEKQRAGIHDIEFSEQELRIALGKDAPHLHAVMDLLKQEGGARKADTPGWWIID